MERTWTRNVVSDAAKHARRRKVKRTVRGCVGTQGWRRRAEEKVERQDRLREGFEEVGSE